MGPQEASCTLQVHPPTTTAALGSAMEPESATLQQDGQQGAAFAMEGLVSASDRESGAARRMLLLLTRSRGAPTPSQGRPLIRSCSYR